MNIPFTIKNNRAASPLYAGVVLCVIFFAAGCGKQNSGTELKGGWQYREGFSLSWLSGDVSGPWKPTESLKFSAPFTRSNIDECRLTLRREIPKNSFRRLHRGEELALFIHEVMGQRIDFYFNEKLFTSIGKEGRMYPAWWRTVFEVLPSRAFRPGKRNFLNVVFYSTNETAVSSSNLLLRNELVTVPCIGNARQLFREYLIVNIISFLIAGAYLLVGLYHLLLFFRRPRDWHYMYFACFSFSLVLFLAANLACRELIWGDNIIPRFIADRISLKIMTATFVLFLSTFFLRKHSLLSLIISAYCLFLVPFDVMWEYSYIQFWYPAIFASCTYGIVLLVRQIGLKNKSAMILLAGILGIVAGAVNDILLTHGFISGPYYSPYLLMIFYVGITLILVNNFVAAHNEAENLNRNLEKLVEEKTEKLLSANERIASLTRKKMFLQAYDLTYREQEIISLILNGLSTGELAEYLEISPRTVEKHIQNIFQKLQVHSRMEIVALYNDFSL